MIMGILIIVMALAVEIAFMAYAIKTRDRQDKSRNWLRIAAFVAFVLLALTPAIEWGFRWYSFAALLALLTVIAAVRLYTNNTYLKGEGQFSAKEFY